MAQARTISTNPAKSAPICAASLDQPAPILAYPGHWANLSQPGLIVLHLSLSGPITSYAYLKTLPELPELSQASPRALKAPRSLPELPGLSHNSPRAPRAFPELQMLF